MIAGADSSEHRYVVQPGDWLSKIAPKYGEDWPTLYADNRGVVGADPNLIFPGQVLNVRHASASRVTVTPVEKRDAPVHRPVSHRPGGTVTRSSAGDSPSSLTGIFGPQAGCASAIVSRESGWNVHAANPSSGAYGLPQALPGSKMASAGPDWRDNPATQLRWMRSYVDSVYGGACAAWSFWQGHSYY